MASSLRHKLHVGWTNYELLLKNQQELSPENQCLSSLCETEKVRREEKVAQKVYDRAL